MNARLMRKFRPARETVASPRASSSGVASASRRFRWAGSLGAARVTTPRHSGILGAAVSTAAPPRLCPTSSAGARPCSRRNAAAATRSSTLELKVVSANFPADCPSPVKSKRRLPIPSAASAALSSRAARRSLEQVKQWANNAQPRARPRGGCSLPARVAPLAPVNSIRSTLMRPSSPRS